MAKIQNYIRFLNGSNCLSASLKGLLQSFGNIWLSLATTGAKNKASLPGKSWRIFGALLISLLACTACRQKMPGEIETIAALRQMQELATVEYTVTKVVKANDNKDWYKFGDRKILFTCEAAIKAGIDLSQLEENNIHIRGKDIDIQLPPPKILTVNMPPENIKMAYADVGILRSNFSAEEKNALLVQAEKQIGQAARESGILDQAKLNTQTFMLQWLRQMGFEQIALSFDAATKGPGQKDGYSRKAP